MALALAASRPDTAPPADLTGRWSLEQTLPRFGVTFSTPCQLTQTGAAIQGVCGDQQGKTFAVTGSRSGGVVTLNYRTDFAGVSARFVFNGELQSDGGLKGTLAIGELPGTFTATRH